MIKSFFCSKKWALTAYGLGCYLLVALLFQTGISVLFNDWFGRWLNLMQRSLQIGIAGLDTFYALLWEWLILAFISVGLTGLVNYVARRYAFDWRKALTFYYTSHLGWTGPREKIEGESQRIQEDTYMFAKIVDSLGIKLVRTIMILIVFLPMLWNFSKLVDPTIIDLLKTADLSDYWLFLPAIIMFALTIDFFVADKRGFWPLIILIRLFYRVPVIGWVLRKINSIFTEDRKKLRILCVLLLFVSCMPALWLLSKINNIPFIMPDWWLWSMYATETLVLMVALWFASPKFLKSVVILLASASLSILLWGLSNGVATGFISHIQGSLVWIALITSLGGMAISWVVGIALPDLQYNNQKTEAALRRELVFCEDDYERRTNKELIARLFSDLEANYRRLFLHYGYFDLWGSWYDIAMSNVPALLVARGLFTGTITYGDFGQIENIFFRVHSGFSIMIDNWTKWTELRSIVMRLHEFEANLDKYQSKQKEELS